jgi:hypothetical protein
MSKITAVLIAAGFLAAGCGDFETGAVGGSPLAGSGPGATTMARTPPPAPTASIDPSLEELAAWPIAASRGR